MSKAFGGRVPRADARDQGNCPERLQNLSYRMAMFLRHDAPKRKILNDGGWMTVRDLLAALNPSYPCETWVEDDVLKVVETSYSKDRPRFEQEYAHDCYGYQVRANNGQQARCWAGESCPGKQNQCGNRKLSAPWSEARNSHADRAGQNWQQHRPSDDNTCQQWGDVHAAQMSGRMNQDRGWQQSWGSSGKPMECRRHDNKCRGWEATSSAFDGAWERTRPGLAPVPLCDISGSTLTWVEENQKSVEIQVCGSDINVPDGATNTTIKGTLTRAGDQISFADGDTWVRRQRLTGDNKDTLPSRSNAALARSTIWSSHEKGNFESSGASSVIDGDRNATWQADTGKTEVPTYHMGDDESGAAIAEKSGWMDQRAKADFDATVSDYGSDYLSLQKGELLSVQRELADNWAYGYSYQREKYGWFPPSYAELDRPDV